MKLVIISLLSVFVLYTKGQTTELTNYYCSANYDTIQFTLYSASHSAWNSSSDCALQQCNINLNNTNNCLLSSTACFSYRTIDNKTYCAPGVLCSILEPCDNITYTCASNTAVCVINSCCTIQTVCLPLSLLNVCASEAKTTEASMTSVPLTSLPEITSLASTSAAELTSSTPSTELTSLPSFTKSDITSDTLTTQ